MATRSTIAVELKGEENIFLEVYCHYDGDIAWNGRYLNEFFNSYDKVLKLVNGGNIKTIDKDGKVDYFHDGEKPFRAKGVKNLGEQEYIYIFSAVTNEWVVRKVANGTRYINLKQALKNKGIK